MVEAFMRRAATLAITLATLTACAAEPMAAPAQSAGRSPAATADVAAIGGDVTTVPFAFVVYLPCANGGAGEVLQVSGELRYRDRYVTPAQGERLHYVVAATFTGTGTGWDTGEVYDVATRELSQGNTAWGTDGILDSGEQQERIQLGATSWATGAVSDIVLVGRFVQTPSGEFVLDSWDGTARCD